MTSLDSDLIKIKKVLTRAFLIEVVQFVAEFVGCGVNFSVIKVFATCQVEGVGAGISSLYPAALVDKVVLLERRVERLGTFYRWEVSHKLCNNCTPERVPGKINSVHVR